MSVDKITSSKMRNYVSRFPRFVIPSISNKYIIVLAARNVSHKYSSYPAPDLPLMRPEAIMRCEASTLTVGYLASVMYYQCAYNDQCSAKRVCPKMWLAGSVSIYNHF